MFLSTLYAAKRSLENIRQWMNQQISKHVLVFGQKIKKFLQLRVVFEKLKIFKIVWKPDPLVKLSWYLSLQLELF